MNSSGWKFVLGIVFVAGLVGVGLFLMQPGPGGNADSMSDAVYFGRVLLGTDPSDESKVIHFIVRGREIYVDQNRDGIPQPEELNSDRELDSIEDTAAGVTYDVSAIRTGLAPEILSENRPQQLGLNVKISGALNFLQSGSMVLSRDAEDSSWLNFHGPIRMFYADEVALRKSAAKPTELKIYLGSIVDDPSSTDVSAEGVIGGDWISRTAFIIPDETTPFPTVTINYPSDGEPVIQELVLDTFC